MQDKTSLHLSNFLAFTRALCAETIASKEHVNICEKQTTDLLHQLELGSAKERNKFATQLARVRRARRKSKDFLEVNNELAEYMQTQEFIVVYRRLEQLLGSVRKHERYIENKRAYNPRVCTNLTINLTEDSR